MASLINVFAKYLIARAISNGEDLNHAKLDGMFADFATAINTINTRLNGITNADGTLKNVPTATALGLAGLQRFSATASQTTFISTTILWDSAFSASSVAMYAAGVRIDPNTVTVSNSGGYLRAVIAAQPVNTIVVMAAYATGAGIENDLASNSPALGASLVGIEDTLALYSGATNVEVALQRVMTDLNNYIALVGPLADYLRADGTIAFTADQDADGFTIGGLRASAANGEAVRHEQISASSLLAILAASLSATYLTLVGGTMSGPLNMGGNKITSLGTGTAAGDGVTLAQMNAAILASSAGFQDAIGVVKMYGGVTPPTNWLSCDGSAISRVTYASLYAIIGVTFGVGDSVTTFNLPDFNGRAAEGPGNGTSDGIQSIAVTAVGTGYNADPTISFTGGGGSGATARAVRTGTTVTSIVLLTRGTGYTSAPAVVITPVSGGSGATATTSLTWTGRAAGVKYGEPTHIQIEAELARHTHDLTSHSNLTNNGTDGIVTGDDTLATSDNNRLQYAGSNTAFNVTGPRTTVMHIIKYQ